MAPNLIAADKTRANFLKSAIGAVLRCHEPGEIGRKGPYFDQSGLAIREGLDGGAGGIRTDGMDPALSFPYGQRNMIMPSLLTWVIGGAVPVVLSVVLRYLANEAHDLARTRARASIPPKPVSASKFSMAAK